MRWDDIQLLKLIDALEETGGQHLWTGLELFHKASEGKETHRGADERSFARELVLASDAGFLTWKQMNIHVGATFEGNVNTWLQDIGEIRLTIAGRDRARGRLASDLCSL
ncbi:MAG: hypothetical protein M0Z39_08310 [Actinomycetota bacterium]|jgi:hypothetical protein|nr:hypothetical protein [Actinomycetota bacterium]